MTNNSIDLYVAVNSARQLNALLLNLFERGAEGLEQDNELIGLALNLSGSALIYLESEEKQDE